LATLRFQISIYRIGFWAAGASEFASDTAEDWLHWGLKHWGNRWDAFGEADRLDLVSSTKIKLTLETRWRPPLDLFDCWVDLVSDVRAGNEANWYLRKQNRRSSAECTRIETTAKTGICGIKLRTGKCATAGAAARAPDVLRCPRH
jgi:hypothetical protein